MATLYERMKAAWKTNDPSALDREAERMARQGVAETEIYSALEELLLALRDAGLEEEADDRINDVMDRVTGWCHPSCHIRTVHNTLPTEEEIAKLPRWARVAFAARCARRVLPLYAHYWPETPVKWTQSLEFSCSVSEVAAAHAGAWWGEQPEGVDFRQASETIHEAVTAVPHGAGFTPALDAASAASLAADSTISAMNRRNDSAVYLAASAAHQASEKITNIIPHIRRDFDHLASLAEWQKWDDDTPVPPEVFGPLWLEGPPKGWPPVTDAPHRTELVIEAFARERATEQMIEDDIVNLFNALNRYHIARSGVRLTLEQFQSLLAVSVTVGV